MERYYVGWHRDANHDNIWALTVIKWGIWYNKDTDFVVIWGRRGRSLQHKVCRGWSHSDSELRIHKKSRMGYQEVKSHQMDEVYPGFDDDIRKIEAWAALQVQP